MRISGIEPSSVIRILTVETKEKIVLIPIKPVRAGYSRILHLFIFMLNRWSKKVYNKNPYFHVTYSYPTKLHSKSVQKNKEFI